MNSAGKIALIAGVVLLAGLAAVTLLRSRPNATGSGLPENFTYNIDALTKTNPALLLYKEAPPLHTGLKQAHALAAGVDGRIYVGGDQSVCVFDEKGARVATLPFAETPHCLAVSRDGTLFVGLTRQIAVCKLGADNQTAPIMWAPLDAKALLTSLAVSAQNLFAADAGNRLVIRFDLNGKELARIGRRDPARNVHGFIVPSPYFDVAVGPDDRLFAANPGCHRVETFNFDGAFCTSFGETGMSIEKFCGCCNPAHLALLPDGSFVTAEKGLCRVKIYAPNGKFIGVVAGPEAFARNHPRAGNDGPSAIVVGDLAVDRNGRVLVLDPGGGDVRIFAKKTQP